MSTDTISRVLSALSVFLALHAAILPGFAHAQNEQPLVPPNRCEVIVKSILDREEAIQFAQNIDAKYRYRSVFLARNGWHAISIGSLQDAEAKRLMAEMKSIGEIPVDSFCTTGKRLVQKYEVGVSKDVTNTTRASTSSQASTQ